MEISTLFVVRVWRQPQRGRSVFRASVRAVDVEQEHLFTRPADLAHYLDCASAAAPSAALADARTPPRAPHKEPPAEGTA